MDQNTFDLGQKMKEKEAKTRFFLPKNSFAVVRVDGRAFHTFTKGLERPYDLDFMASMDQVAKALMKEISGSLFAFTQSDEVSVIFSDTASSETEMYFKGNLSKIISVSASLATLTFNEAFKEKKPEMKKPALFDARVFVIEKEDIFSYFSWRQKDTIRNSVSMAAQAHFSHKSLQKLNTKALKEKLLEKDVSWDSFPDSFKYGRKTEKVLQEEEVSFTHKKTNETSFVKAIRTKYETFPAEVFTPEFFESF